MSETVRTATKEWRWLRREVIIRDDYECQAVECDAKGGRRGDAELHVHHIVPYSEGGPTEKNNLKTFCSACHRETSSYGGDGIDYSPPSPYTQETVIEALDAGERVQASEVAERIGSSSGTARKYLKEAKAEGEVVEHRDVREGPNGTPMVIGAILWSLDEDGETA
jgi:hypothetical protein